MNSISHLSSSFNPSLPMCVQPEWFPLLDPSCLKVENLWKEARDAIPLITSGSCDTFECVDLSPNFPWKLSYHQNNDGCGLNWEFGEPTENLRLKIANGQTSLSLSNKANYLTAMTDFKQFVDAEWKVELGPKDGITGSFKIKQDPLSPEKMAILFKNNDWEISGDCQTGSNQVWCVFKQQGLDGFEGFARANMFKKEDSNGGSYYSFDITSEPTQLFPFPKSLASFNCYLDVNNKITSALGRIENIDGSALFNASSPEDPAKNSFVGAFLSNSFFSAEREKNTDAPLFEGKFDCFDGNACSGESIINLNDKDQMVIEHRTNDQHPLYQHQISFQQKGGNNHLAERFLENNIDIGYSNNVQKSGSLEFDVTSRVKVKTFDVSEHKESLHVKLGDHKQLVEHESSKETLVSPFSSTFPLFSWDKKSSTKVVRAKEEGKQPIYRIINRDSTSKQTFYYGELAIKAAKTVFVAASVGLVAFFYFRAPPMLLPR